MRVKFQPVYITVDNKQFNEEIQAEKHEDSLVKNYPLSTLYDLQWMQKNDKEKLSGSHSKIDNVENLQVEVLERKKTIRDWELRIKQQLVLVRKSRRKLNQENKKNA
jgi:hypothetical protein